jgi:hypothetical protein
VLDSPSTQATRRTFGSSGTRWFKNKQTGPFLVIHNSPGKHWKTNHGSLTLNLQSLIEDFHQAVDDLGELLRSSDEMRELAARELDGRTVRLVPIE